MYNMTRMLRTLIVSTVIIRLSTGFVFADLKGTTAIQSLKVIAVPRIAAMGEAFGAVSGDVNSVLSNPAGLGFVRRNQVSLVQNNWIEGIVNQYAAFALPMWDFCTLGLNVNMLSAAGIDKRDNLGNLKGSFDVSEIVAGLSFARAVNEKLGFGLNIKSINGTIDDEQAIGYAGDVGVLFKASQKLSVGVAAQNIGTEVKYINQADPLPMNIKLGTSFLPTKSLMIVLDANMPNDNDVRISAGFEYTLGSGKMIQIPIRAGYRTGYDTEGMSGLSAGCGLIFGKKFTIDSSWNPMGEEFGNTLKFGLKLTI